METGYISIETALQTAWDYRVDVEENDYDRGYNAAVWDIMKELNATPPSQVQPVRHGRWKKVPGYATPGGDPVWGCSECGKGLHVYGVEHGAYGSDIADTHWVSCPNCGAVMT